MAVFKYFTKKKKTVNLIFRNKKTLTINDYNTTYTVLSLLYFRPSQVLKSALFLIIQRVTIRCRGNIGTVVGHFDFGVFVLFDRVGLVLVLNFSICLSLNLTIWFRFITYIMLNRFSYLVLLQRLSLFWPLILSCNNVANGKS